MNRAFYHLPGLYEFTEFYKIFLPLWNEHREFFEDWCEIGSIYGAPADALWGGGRVGFGDAKTEEVLAMLREFGISGRLTFSNSLLRKEHLSDRQCNRICELFEQQCVTSNGVIVHSDLLADYLQKTYPGLYLVSSTTKVLTSFEDFETELKREEFKFVVLDYRLNREWDELDSLPQEHKAKTEFLCNECCDISCKSRKACYENVSRKALGEDCEDHICGFAVSGGGYRFSKAMTNPSFIGTEDILRKYIPMGFENFKIEGRGLGSALLLEFILYYMTKPEYRLKVREEIYLDSSLDLF